MCIFDKNRIQALINHQRTNLADVDYLDLNSVAKIVNNFENPQIPREENPYRADREDRKNREDTDSDVRFRSEEGDVFFSNAEREPWNNSTEKGGPMI